MRQRRVVFVAVGLIAMVALVCACGRSEESGGSREPATKPAAAGGKHAIYDTWPFGAAEASRRQTETAAALGIAKDLTLDLGGGASMKLVLIPAGKFQMGSLAGEEKRNDDETQHEVTLTHPFYMGIHEVTQEQYEQIAGRNPSYFKGRTNPVETVSWEDATAFCKKLSTKTGRTVRLPTEAQWEYACRAGTRTPFHTGATISTDEANYRGSYTYGNGRKGVHRSRTVPVGSFRANAFGLYDMHGNVCEWCQDWYGSYANASVRDPQGPASGKERVVRGGSWSCEPADCRSANRSSVLPGSRGWIAAFRVVVLLFCGVD